MLIFKGEKYMNTIYNALHRAEKQVDKIILGACGAGMAIITILVALQVIFRYVIGNSLSWSEEFARYVEVWVVYLGSAYAFGKGQHISMDILHHILPVKGIWILDKINSCLCLFFACFCLVYSYKFMVTERSQLMASVRVPKNVAYAALFVGMILMIFYSLVVIFKTSAPEEDGGAA